MNELKIKETITSLELLEQINLFRRKESEKSELQHYDLLKIIRNEFEDEIGVGKISLSSYRNSQNKEQPMFILTFSQAKQVLVRESKAVRKAVIHYIEELENKLKNPFGIPQNFKEALLLAVKQQEQIESLQKQAEENKPKVLFANAVETSKNSILVGELAKMIKQNGVDIGQNKLFAWLRQHGYLGTRGEFYNVPTQKSMDLKIMEIKKTTNVNADGSIRTNTTPKITGKGQSYFVNKFLN